MNFNVRTITKTDGIVYLRKEDVAELIREAASTQVTDDRRFFEELAASIDAMGVSS